MVFKKTHLHLKSGSKKNFLGTAENTYEIAKFIPTQPSQYIVEARFGAKSSYDGQYSLKVISGAKDMKETYIAIVAFIIISAAIAGITKKRS